MAATSKTPRLTEIGQTTTRVSGLTGRFKDVLDETLALARNSLGRQVGRLSLPRYFITWSGHVQACVQGWPRCNRGVFPAVDHDRSRT